MKAALTVLLLAGLAGCAPNDAKDPASTDTAARKKTSSEEAFDAGQRARKKAEDIKKEQNKKVQDAVESTDQ
ncbi:MAG TPA: hypothetical protein VFT12_05370 [Thermoanaerobaculia bacterium]|nr:hypothetical protein [Thermoanaerobaculia bacterium]